MLNLEKVALVVMAVVGTSLSALVLVLAYRLSQGFGGGCP